MHRKHPMQEPGVLGDHWPWGPPLALVTIPKHLAQSYCALTFVIVRSLDDTEGRSYRDVEGRRWPTACILTRKEASWILGQSMPSAMLERVLAKVEAVLGGGPAGCDAFTALP